MSNKLFADPAWDILLELFVLQDQRHPISITGVCLATPVPITTALRHLTKLEHCNQVVRHGDPTDGRVLNGQ